jgi:glycosyltransferase involved in cell wall biosynthesis
MSNELVSVVIPTHNNGTFVCEAIESVLAQSYQNREIIVVDDGSADGTRDILKPYLEKINYVFQENQGPAVARNQGIRHSHGSYIAFLDADDVWLEDKLDRQMRLFREQKDVGMVFGELDHWTELGKRIPTTPVAESSTPGPSSGGIIFDDAFKLLLESCCILTSTVVMSRACIDAVGVFNETLRAEEDRDLWLRVARKLPIGKIERVLVHKRGHERNFSLKSKLFIEWRIRLFEAILNDPGPLNDPDLVALRRQLASLYCQWGVVFLEERNRREARQRFSKSLAISTTPGCLMLFLYSFLNDFMSNLVKACYRSCYRICPSLRM